MDTIIQAPILRRQCSKSLPAITASITTHNPKTRQAVFCQPEQGSGLTEWHDPVDNDQMAFFTLYHTATVPTKTKNDLDLHQQLMDARTGGPPLVVPNGVVCRMVDFAPGYSSVDHRSLSIDYGVVIEDDRVDPGLWGDVQHLARGNDGAARDDAPVEKP